MRKFVRGVIVSLRLHPSTSEASDLTGLRGSYKGLAGILEDILQVCEDFAGILSGSCWDLEGI